jgi:peptidoglycan/LPS O-acetylase OafA/YrhL
LLSHYKELDGIRGIAILLVLIFHCRFAATPGTQIQLQYFLLADMGWIGVDLFFVLSGFLITRILLDTHKDKDYFRNFYARRMLRIFPLYYSVLALVHICSRLTPTTSIESTSSLAEMSYWIHLQNWLPAPEHTQILGGFWSLAIEEQFYFVWPLLIMFAAKYGQVEKLCLALWIFTVGFRFWWISQGYEDAYYITFTRLDGLVLGAFVAARVNKYGFQRLRTPALAFGILAVAVIALVRIVNGRFYGIQPMVLQYGLAALAVLFSSFVVIAVTGREEGVLRRLLRHKWLRFFGTISFGLYVYHVGVVIFLRYINIVPNTHFWQAQIMFFTIVITLSSLLAWLSFRYFEKPVMQIRPKLPRPIVNPL